VSGTFRIGTRREGSPNAREPQREPNVTSLHVSGAPALGVIVPYVDGVVTSGDAMSEFAETLEACGVESVWTVEHVIEADQYELLYPYDESGRMPGRFVPMADPLEILAFLAARSQRLRLGTAVMVAPLHPAVVLAKRAATLAGLSGGRLLLGLGIGWQREEYDAVGVPYADRGRRLEESVGAMRELWAHRPATFTGRHVDFDRVHLVPPPPDGRVPIILGGNSPAAIDRCGRLADGWYPHAISPGDFAAGADRLRDAAVAAGRSPLDVPISVDPSSVDRTKWLDRDWVQQYVDHGATRLVIRSGITGPGDVGAVRETVERYREQVLERLAT
jgi:probable F420-dependent oxidoreductase